MVDSQKIEGSQQFSNQLFYRVYLILVVCIIIIGSFLDFFINKIDTDEYIDELINLHQPTFLLITDTLLNKDITVWEDEIRRLSQLTKLNLSLLEKKDFATNPELLNQLSSGRVVNLYGEKDTISLYQQLEKTAYIVEIETTDHGDGGNNFSWIPIIFYTLIAFVIFLLIQPFAKQLMQLKSAALKIGTGDFSTRLTMPRSSSLYPIAEAFDTMTGEIETLMLRQRDLTNAVSHELRTPLARMKFAFEELEVYSKKSHWQENINEMRLDVAELENLIDEMLLYAQANQIKEFEKKDVRVLELIDDLIQSQQAKTIEILKTIDGNIDLNTIIVADVHSLFRALSNVLRNSISFSKNFCCVDVSLKLNTITITITDDGPGINNEIINRIFEPFVKIDNSDRKSGYGLGLAIAKSIITKHNGIITVTNGKEKGACFSITIPCN